VLLAIERASFHGGAFSGLAAARYHTVAPEHCCASQQKLRADVADGSNSDHSLSARMSPSAECRHCHARRPRRPKRRASATGPNVPAQPDRKRPRTVRFFRSPRAHAWGQAGTYERPGIITRFPNLRVRPRAKHVSLPLLSHRAPLQAARRVSDRHDWRQQELPRDSEARRSRPPAR
jgi:hypothetical protein